MADETPAAPVAEDQTATDPRLEQAQAAPVEAAEAAPEPAEGAEAAPVAEAAPEPAETPPEGEKKPKKSVEEALKGRVGHLTKTLNTKDAELVEERRLRQAAETLLAAGRRPEGEADAPPASAQAHITDPAQGRTYTQAEFEEQVHQTAAAAAFNKAADDMYDAGVAKYPDFKDAMDTLRAVGILGKDSPVAVNLLDAAMATDNGAAVMHHLGNDIDEATRIANLPPIRMAAELTKLATKLGVPKQTPISSAPAPIRGVNGSASPTVDLERAAADGGNDMSAYAAARTKQVPRWSRPRGERTN